MPSFNPIILRLPTCFAFRVKWEMGLVFSVVFLSLRVTSLEKPTAGPAGEDGTSSGRVDSNNGMNSSGANRHIEHHSSNIYDSNKDIIANISTFPNSNSSTTSSQPSSSSSSSSSSVPSVAPGAKNNCEYGVPFRFVPVRWQAAARPFSRVMGTNRPLLVSGVHTLSLSLDDRWMVTAVMKRKACTLLNSQLFK